MVPPGTPLAAASAPDALEAAVLPPLAARLTLSAANRNDEAIKAFQEATRLKPDYAEAHNNLGTVLKRRRRLEEALQVRLCQLGLVKIWGLPNRNGERIIRVVEKALQDRHVLCLGILNLLDQDRVQSGGAPHPLADHRDKDR